MDNEIIVEPWGNGYKAFLKRNPVVADWGSSPTCAIGRVVERYPHEFQVKLTIMSGLTSE